MRPPRTNAGAGAQRVRCFLDPADWLCDLLQAQGGPKFHKTVLLVFHNRFPADELKLCASLRVSIEACVLEQGLLTNWNREANLERLCYGFPNDCYSLCVEEVLTCIDTVIVDHKRSRSFYRSRCAAAFDADTAAWLASRAGGQGKVWRISCDMFLQTPCASAFRHHILLHCFACSAERGLKRSGRALEICLFFFVLLAAETEASRDPAEC